MFPYTVKGSGQKTVSLPINTGLFLCTVDQHGVNSGETLCIIGVYANGVNITMIKETPNFTFTVSKSGTNVIFTKSNNTQLYVNCVFFGEYY